MRKGRRETNKRGERERERQKKRDRKYIAV
jgi:hypothetical protein